MSPITTLGFKAGPDVPAEERALARKKVQSWPRARKLAVFTSQVSRLEKTLKKFPRKMWGFKPSKNNWCIGEALWHLADHEANMFTRLRFAVAEPGTCITPYNNDKWADRLLYIRADFGQALAILKLLRKANADLMKRLTAKAWKAKMKHPEHGMLTVEWLVGMTIWHTEHHFGQMAKRYKQWKEKKR